MRNILLALSLFICGTCFGQGSTPPETDNLYYITVFTHADWAKRPEEKALIDAIRKEPMRATVLSHKFNHYTDQTPIYKERFASIFPESQFPIIIRQKPDGGYVYKASGSNIPSGSRAILNDMKMYNQLIPGNRDSSIELAAEQEPEDDIDQRRPFLPRNQPDEDEYPDSETIFRGRETPILDAISGGVSTMYALVILFFLLIGSMAFAIAMAVINKFLK